MMRFIRALFGPPQPYEKPRSPKMFTRIELDGQAHESATPFSFYEGLAKVTKPRERR